MAGPDDVRQLCRYPFLPAARDWVRDEEYSLADLLTDPVFAGARRRGADRVKGALAKDGIVETPAAAERDAVFELLSYPLARALVSSVEDRYLSNRYAVAESKLFNARLSAETDDGLLWDVVQGIGLPITPSQGGYARVGFLDFLRAAPGRDPAWKLVNQRLADGFVTLERGQVVRLAEEVLKDRILEELETLPRPGRELLRAFERDLNEIKTVLAAHRERFGSEAGGPVRVEAFPPCMQAIWKGIQGHVNIPHMGRFAIVAFLHTLGMTSEDILKFFGSVPDFDVNKSRYQIEHISGQIGATEYSPPGCNTMQTYGICPLEQRDEICLFEIHHPLSYYRKKLRRIGPPRPATNGAPPAATGVTPDAGTGPRAQPQ